jgi:antitoxin ParD1/3/4
MTSTVADILQRIEALSQSEQQELVTAICDRWGIANGSEATDWAESIRDKIDEAYASTEPAVDGSTFIQKRRSAIYQDRLQDLQRDALIGWEAAQRGESIDGPTAIAQIRARLHTKIDYH